MSGPQKVPDADGEMKPRPSDEAQLERDYEAAKESREGERLAKATERARAKGKIR